MVGRLHGVSGVGLLGLRFSKGLFRLDKSPVDMKAVANGFTPFKADGVEKLVSFMSSFIFSICGSVLSEAEPERER